MKRSYIKRGKKKLGPSQKPEAIARRVCDYMWGTLIILRDQVCMYCHKNIATVGHHIFAKKDCPRTRYELLCGIGLCIGCHDPKIGGVAHTNPEAVRHINKAKVGKGWDALKARALMPGKVNHDFKLIEIMLWQDFKAYHIYKPEGWDGWKEWKKIKWLREVRNG